MMTAILRARCALAVSQHDLGGACPPLRVVSGKRRADHTDLDRLFDQIRQQKGRLDIVLANAGVAKYAPLWRARRSRFFQ